VTISFWRTICVLAALALTGQSPALVPLQAGMIIDRSVTIRSGTYRLSASPDLARPATTIPLVADDTATLPPGNYTLQVISDDGVRVWMDGAMILDEWAPHESKVNSVSIRGGSERRFKVEYYDVTGFAELRFDIQRK
jgi:hypothetical protein